MRIRTKPHILAMPVGCSATGACARRRQKCKQTSTWSMHGTGAAVAAGRDQKTSQLPPWDFVLFRDDGSGLRLHPEWSKTAVAAYHVDCHEEPVMPPMKGCGESWGSGTYRYYKKLGVINNLKFDARKGAKLGSEPKTSPTESVTPLPFRPCSSHPPLHAPDRVPHYQSARGLVVFIHTTPQSR